MVKTAKLNLNGVGAETKGLLKRILNKNPFNISDNMFVQENPLCPRKECEDYGKKWQCYTEYYKECFCEEKIE